MIHYLQHFLTFYGIIQILGIVAALHSILHTRTPQGTIAWIFALIFLPVISLPFYLVLGRRRFPEYNEPRNARHTSHQDFIALMDRCVDRLLPFTRTGITTRGSMRKCVSDLVSLPFTQGNDLKILIDGKETFNSLFRSIDKAQEYILIEFFIINNDRMGENFQKILLKKAREGVKIYLVFDEIGSHKLPRKYLCALQAESNITLTPFGGKRRWFSNIIRLNFRNHRKIVIVDGKKAFIGGLNIGDEYMGRGSLGAWRDTFCQIKGPAIECVQLAFFEDWLRATGEVLDFPAQFEPRETDKSILILPSGPADEKETWKLSTVALINDARERLWIASPYFVPGSEIISALQLAAMRGVDVRILLPDKADHLLVYGSSFTFYPESFPYGIKFYRYMEGFLHEKVMLIDDDLSVIGTANLDNRSMRLNFEINALIHNRETASEMEKMFELDFARSQEVTEEDFNKNGWFFKLGCRIARLLAPLQ